MHKTDVFYRIHICLFGENNGKYNSYAYMSIHVLYCILENDRSPKRRNRKVKTFKVQGGPVPHGGDSSFKQHIQAGTVAQVTSRKP